MPTINGLPAFTGSIDPVNDLLPIYQNSSISALAINRNQLLNLASQPVGTTDSQTLTNKTLTAPTISGPTLSGTVLGTYTLGGTPTFPSSVVTLTGSQTLTNKILTSPTITTPTITNPTLSVDSISGFSTSTIVTAGGVQFSNGVLNTAGAVTAASLAAGAATPTVVNGTSWSWTAFTPSWTNITVGNGTNSAWYTQIGKMVMGFGLFLLGTTSAVGSSPSFTPPVARSSNYNDALYLYNIGTSNYNITSNYTGVLIFTGNSINLTISTVSSTYPSLGGISASVPASWTTGNYITYNFYYQAA